MTYTMNTIIDTMRMCRMHVTDMRLLIVIHSVLAHPVVEPI